MAAVLSRGDKLSGQVHFGVFFGEMNIDKLATSHILFIILYTVWNDFGTSFYA